MLMYYNMLLTFYFGLLDRKLFFKLLCFNFINIFQVNTTSHMPPSNFTCIFCIFIKYNTYVNVSTKPLGICNCFYCNLNIKTLYMNKTC